MSKRCLELANWRLNHPVNMDKEENATLLKQSIKQSTSNQYKTPVSYFETISEFPLTGDKLITFIRALLSNGYLSPTIRKYLSAVKSTSINLGYPPIPPEQEPAVSRALMAADRLAPGNEVKKAPLLDDRAVRSLAALKLPLHSENDEVRSVALLSICCLLRLCEPFSIVREDISTTVFGEKLVVSVKLRDTKMKPIEVINIECTNKCTLSGWCPAHFLKRAKETPGRLSTEKIFTRVNQGSLCKKLKELLSKEFATSYHLWKDVALITGHSFRRTGANIMFRSKQSKDLIMCQGRWSSEVWREYCVEAMNTEVQSIPCDMMKTICLK
jgi:hypothetical protein